MAGVPYKAVITAAATDAVPIGRVRGRCAARIRVATARTRERFFIDHPFSVFK
jgi:hypothetical protein